MTNRTYLTMLEPWTVVRWLAPTDRTVLARFRSRSDAEGYLIVLRRLMPEANLQVVFDAEQNKIH
ncbi:MULTISPECIES: hypothetical protein [Nostocales]|uniref:Uncharacterized protein n=1 Tax=Tolypothrix bouteillei VB521301 TaxID=1479485 RepID=A0A0C1RKR2_9CYAN